jgi:hypothetical protein
MLEEALHKEVDFIVSSEEFQASIPDHMIKIV